MKRTLTLAIVAGLHCCLAFATGVFPEPDFNRFSDRHFDDTPEWVEESAKLPAFPRDSDLIEFTVSAATANHFFIDGATLAVGSDAVVRYTLVIRAAGGASNISYEGMHCGIGSVKRYAVGRSDGTWSWLRSGDWQPIENKLANRQYAALSREYFCPLGNPIRSADEGRDALRRGGHPATNTSPYKR